MPYTKNTWQDRSVERPLTFTLQSNADGSTTLVPAEGTIVTTGTPITADKLNNLEQQYDNAVADAVAQANTVEAWTLATLSNNWVQAGTGYAYAAFLKQPDGMVCFRGAIKSGAISTTLAAFLLPVGYRPQYTMYFPTLDNDYNVGVIKVQSDGFVFIVKGNNAWISLDSVRFPIMAS